MLKVSQLKELSFLIYGLGLSGLSVIKFFKKKIKLITSLFGMINIKLYLKNTELEI